MATKHAVSPLQNWQDWVNLVLGIWLFVSPWELQYLNVSPLASDTAFVIGAMLFVVSLTSRFAFHKNEEIIDLVLGVALMVSPWALDYAAIAMAMDNALIVGGVVIYFAVWSLWDARSDTAHST